MIRKSVITASLLLIMGLFSLNSFAMKGNDPVGTWKFSAPTAPYGYEKGLIEISKDGDELIGTMSFDGMQYKFDMERLKFADDIITFGLFIDGDDVFIKMSFGEKDELSGKAVTSEGEIPMTAKRENKEE